MSKIIRRPDRAEGGITEEERARMEVHSALWIQRSFRTEPTDPQKIEAAIKGIYAAANLAEPRVIVVPSPLVMAMAGGISSVWWYLFENNLLGKKPSRAAATDAATFAATRAATDDATYAATYAATDDATRAATRAATAAATAAGLANWRSLASYFVGEEWALAALQAAQRWFNSYQGGNMWAAFDAYLTAARDILGLRLPSHEAYAHWEQAAIHGGFRWMHPKFCLVSDFPEVLRISSLNQPHAEFGPSHRWRDGFSIWHLNGVRVEQWMAEQHPDEMDARKVLQIENVDQRRECVRRLGSERLVSQLEAKVLDAETRQVGGKYELLAIDMNHGAAWHYLRMQNASIDATHVEAVPRECKTVREAINWRASQNKNTEWFPVQLT